MTVKGKHSCRETGKAGPEKKNKQGKGWKKGETIGMEQEQWI